MIDLNKCNECSESRCILYKTPEEKFKRMLDMKHTQKLIDNMDHYFNKAQEQLKIYTSKLKHDEWSAKRYELNFKQYQRWSDEFSRKMNISS